MQPGGGYRTFPYSFPATTNTLEVYGRGPLRWAASLKTLNAQKRTFLKQGHRAADPVLLVEDDGIIGMDLRPGAVNKGGVKDGRPAVHILPTGNIRSREDDGHGEGHHQRLFLSRCPDHGRIAQMTATEVVERANEKGILLALRSAGTAEYLGPMIDRELDILST